MKRILCFFSAIFFVFASIPIFVLIMNFLFNPLCRSNEYIRNKVLNDIPFGTHILDVEKIISTKSTIAYDIDMENGYGISHETPYIDIGTKVCEKRIILNLGSYNVFFVTTSVEVFLGFDKNGFLIDVSIRKTHDSLWTFDKWGRQTVGC